MTIASLLLALTMTVAAAAPAAEIPEIGQPLPAFRLSDQTGAPRDLASLGGREGLVLLFFRSADW